MLNQKRFIPFTVFILFFYSQYLFAIELPVEIHGFVSQGFLGSNNNNVFGHDTRNGSFEFREVGVNFQKTLGDHLFVGMQLMSRDFGVYGNNKVFMDWAYGRIDVVDPLQVSAGRVKVPFGFYGDIQDFDFLRSSVVLPEAIYSPGKRNFNTAFNGVQLSGTFDLNRAGILEYAVTAGDVDQGPETDFEEWIRSLKAEANEDVAMDLALHAHLHYSSPLEGLKLTGSYIRFINNTITGLQYPFPNQSFSVIVDATFQTNWIYGGIQYTHPFFELTSEVHRVHTPMETSYRFPPLPDTVDTMKRFGGYVSGSVTPLSWLQVGTYGMLYWSNLDDMDGKIYEQNNPGMAWERFRREVALTVSFRISHAFLIRAEGHHVHGTALLSETINPDGFKERWQYGIVKVSFNF